MNRVGVRRTGYFAALLVFVLSALVFVPATAQTPGNPDGALNLIISPPSIGLDAQPGQAVSTDIKIQNQSLAPEKIKASILKFGANGDDGTPTIEDPKPDDESVSWVKFSQDRFSIEPNEWKTIKVTISPP